MKKILLDTSGEGLLVALADGPRIVEQAYSVKPRAHAKRLMPTLESVMKAQEWQPDEVDRIVVVTGPGGFTGVRVGMVSAQALGWSWGVAVEGVSSLLAMALSTTSPKVAVAMDARKQEVYSALFQVQDGMMSRCIPDQVFKPEVWAQYLAQEQDPVTFVGTGVARFASSWANLPRNIEPQDWLQTPSAEGVLRASISESQMIVPGMGARYIREADVQVHR